MPNALRMGCSLYRLLLGFYPREFSQRFGAEMTQVFADQMQEEWKRHRVVGIVRVSLIAGWEVMSVAVPLQLHNSAVIAVALAFVSSSALFLALFRAVSR
ncbi:MAG: hypothetical protein ABSF66_07770 [Terriglobales bacterium]|jgi:hypothetical protein